MTVKKEKIAREDVVAVDFLSNLDLIFRVSRKVYADLTIHGPGQSRTVNPVEGRASPQIRRAEKFAGIGQNSSDQLSWSDLYRRNG
jgi:hypothetical protein